MCRRWPHLARMLVPLALVSWSWSSGAGFKPLAYNIERSRLARLWASRSCLMRMAIPEPNVLLWMALKLFAPGSAYHLSRALGVPRAPAQMRVRSSCR